jgi:hypothetical protein
MRTHFGEYFPLVEALRELARSHFRSGDDF